MFAAIPGVSAPPPFGGNQRTVVVRADPDRLRAYGVSADQVVQALAAGNTITPFGQARVQERMPLVPINAMVTRSLMNWVIFPFEAASICVMWCGVIRSRIRR